MIEWVRRNFNESGSEDEDGFSFDEGYTIHTTEVVEDAYAVLDPAGIPKKGDAHRSGKAVVTNRTAEHLDGSPLDWEVTVTYTKAATQTPGSGGDEDEANRPTLTIGNERATVTISSDFHGNPICNSAGESFSDGYQDDRSHLTITIAKQIKFDKILPSLLNAWKDTVHGPNIGPQFLNNPKNPTVAGNAPPAFFGFGPFIVRFTDFGSTTVKAAKDTDWQINLKFSLAETWLGTALDQGIYENKNSHGNLSPGTLGDIALNLENRKPIIDFAGLPVSRPVLLDGLGGRLKTGKPWFRVFQVKPHGDLNGLLDALGLPKDWNGYRIIIE